MYLAMRLGQLSQTAKGALLSPDLAPNIIIIGGKKQL